METAYAGHEAYYHATNILIYKLHYNYTIHYTVLNYIIQDLDPCKCVWSCLATDILIWKNENVTTLSREGKSQLFLEHSFSGIMN